MPLSQRALLLGARRAERRALAGAGGAALRGRPAGVREQRFLLREATGEVTLEGAGEVQWLYANAGSTGLLPRGVRRPSCSRRSANARRRWRPAERIGLLADQWALVRAGQARSADFLDLARRLRRRGGLRGAGRAGGPAGVRRGAGWWRARTRSASAAWVERLLRPAVLTQAGLGPGGRRDGPGAAAARRAGARGGRRGARARGARPRRRPRVDAGAARGQRTALEPEPAGHRGARSPRGTATPRCSRLLRAFPREPDPAAQAALPDGAHRLRAPGLASAAQGLLFTETVTMQDVAAFVRGLWPTATRARASGELMPRPLDGRADREDGAGAHAAAPGGGGDGNAARARGTWTRRGPSWRRTPCPRRSRPGRRWSGWPGRGAARARRARGLGVAPRALSDLPGGRSDTARSHHGSSARRARLRGSAAARPASPPFRTGGPPAGPGRRAGVATRPRALHPVRRLDVTEVAVHQRDRARRRSPSSSTAPDPRRLHWHPSSRTAPIRSSNSPAHPAPMARAPRCPPASQATARPRGIGSRERHLQPCVRQPRPRRLQLHRGQGRTHALGEGVDRRLRAGVRALHRRVPHVALQHQGDSLAGSLLRPREPSGPVRNPAPAAGGRRASDAPRAPPAVPPRPALHAAARG